MTFRVTQNMFTANLNANLANNMRKLVDYQNQLSTGRRINKPSDDPVGLSYALRYRSEYSENEQYKQNLDSAKSWMDYTDSSLDKSTQVLQRIRELTVQAANSTNSQAALNSISSEVGQLYNELVTIGNSQFNGKYVFNGQKTDIEPYNQPNAAETITIEQLEIDKVHDIQFEIGTGVRLGINITGTQVFGSSTDADNAFAIAKNLMSALNNNNSVGIQNALGLIDQRLDKFLSVRADVGAKMNRIDLITNRTEDTNVNLLGLISKTEDADIAGTITNLQTAQNVYQASLSVGAKIIQPSLVDFLR